MTALRRTDLALLLLLIAAGVTARLLVVFNTDGIYHDLHSFELVLDGLNARGFGVYATIQPTNWPYPPGYFPWVLAAGELERLWPFEQSVRMGAVIADVGIVVLVQDLLGRRGAGRRQRLAGAALVALGPIFIGVSGFNGQLDPAATFWALAAYWVWTREGQRHRALLSGVLLGVAACVKTVPLLLLLPLMATARDRREAIVLLVAAVAVVWLVVSPFRAETPEQLRLASKYAGLPGFGGISLLLEPTFSADVLSGTAPNESPILVAIAIVGPSPVLIPALLALAVLLFRIRPDALTGICLTYLVVYVCGVNFIVSYLVWVLPFLVVRGHLKLVVGLQLALAPAQILVFAAPVDRTLALVAYTGVMAAGWLVAAGVLAVWAVRLVRGGRVAG